MYGPNDCCRRNFAPKILRFRRWYQSFLSASVGLWRRALVNDLFCVFSVSAPLTLILSPKGRGNSNCTPTHTFSLLDLSSYAPLRYFSAPRRKRASTRSRPSTSSMGYSDGPADLPLTATRHG